MRLFNPLGRSRFGQKKVMEERKEEKLKEAVSKHHYFYEPTMKQTKILLKANARKRLKVTVVAVSDLFVPALLHTYYNAKYVPLIDINLVSTKHLNHIGSCAFSNELTRIYSDTYDLSNKSSKGYKTFSNNLRRKLKGSDLIITIGETFEGNHYNNRMPILKYKDVPVIHITKCVSGPLLFRDIQDEVESTIPSLFVEEVLGLSPNYQIDNYDDFLNCLCSALIIMGLKGIEEKIQKKIEQKKSWRKGLVINSDLFKLSEKTIKKAYKIRNPKLLDLRTCYGRKNL